VTGRVVPAANDLIGAGSSYWTFCTSATSLSVIAEESPDNIAGHNVPISVTYGVPAQVNGNACAVIPAGGLFGYPAFNVLAIAGGTITVWYSGSTGVVSTIPPAANSTGATTPTQCDTTIATNAPPSATTELLVGTAVQSVYVCAGQYSFNGAPSAGLISLVYGTGPTCAGSQVLLWVNYTTASTPQTLPLFNGSTVFRVPPSFNVCLVVSTVTVNTQVNLSYARY